MKNTLVLLTLLLMALTAFAQTDSTATLRTPKTSIAQRDSAYYARLNSNANLMIGGGVALCGLSGYLIYQGVKLYKTPVAPNTTTGTVDDPERNHRQGTIYMACGGIAVAGGAVLVALGARNKVDFKLHKKYVSLHSGLLPSGNLGAMLAF